MNLISKGNSIAEVRIWRILESVRSRWDFFQGNQCWKNLAMHCPIDLKKKTS